MKSPSSVKFYNESVHFPHELFGTDLDEERGVRKTPLFFIIALAFWPYASAVAGSDLLAVGKKALEEGRFQECVQASIRILASKPKDTEALRLRALAKSGLGRFDEAIQDYETILENDSDDASTQRDLGLLLAFKKNDPRHALLHLDRYLSLTDDASSSEAERTVKLMRSLDSSHSRLEDRALKELLQMAKSFEAAGNERVAKETYERVLQISPTCSACHEALGRILMGQHRKDDGEKHLEKARLFGING